MADEDILLAGRIARGDSVAFHEAYLKYAPLLYSVCFKMLKDSDDANNAVQAVFVKLWENRKNIVVESSLKNYLYASAKYFILNEIRSRNNEMRRNYRYSQMQDAEDTSEDVRIEKTENELLLSAMEKAVKCLSPQQEKVVNLKRTGLTNEQIANILGISVPTVKFHYSEALKNLRKNIS